MHRGGSGVFVTVTNTSVASSYEGRCLMGDFRFAMLRSEAVVWHVISACDSERPVFHDSQSFLLEP